MSKITSKKTILIYRKNNLLNTAGGVEKVLVWFANSLTKRGYNVYLTTRDKHSGKLFYPLDKKVHFTHLQIKFYRLRRILDQVTFHMFKCFHREYFANQLLRNYCKKIRPDIAILAGVPDLVDFVYSTPYPCKKIVQFHCWPNYYFDTNQKQVNLYKKKLKKADMLQVLLPSFKKIVQEYYTGPIAVIGNPVNSCSLKKKRQNVIIYPARVEPHKQQHLLIEAFSKIAHKYPTWKVHFYGGFQNESYVKKCLKLIQDLHLENQVFFKGNIRKIQEKLAESNICAFPSKSEGFSLALTECMAAGLPCVGFKKSPSVNEMIKDSVNGFLVDSTEEFINQLESLMTNKELFSKMSTNAKKSVQGYLPDKIIDQWEKIFDEN